MTTMPTMASPAPARSAWRFAAVCFVADSSLMLRSRRKRMRREEKDLGEMPWTRNQDGLGGPEGRRRSPRGRRYRQRAGAAHHPQGDEVAPGASHGDGAPTLITGSELARARPLSSDEFERLRRF